ncbi:MAG TPA: hypothetical protein VMV18_10075 [bacterium]|nr:hypothetical protein [bacterium]
MKASLIAGCVLTLSTLASGCVVVGTDVPPPPPEGNPPTAPSYATIDQFASRASASSEGVAGSSDFSALQATGAPDVNVCADSPQAWSPAVANPMPGVSADGQTIDDYLDVGFDQYSWISQVKIYESYAPGAIVAVDLVASDNSAAPLTVYENFTGDGPAPCPSAFVIDIPGGTPAQYDRVAIYFDDNLVGDFNRDGSWNDDFPEVDAVEVVGEIAY